MSVPVTIGPEMSLAEAEDILERRGFNTLPVVCESGELIGVVSSLDLLKAFRFGPDSLFPAYDRIMTRPVGQIMSRDPLTVRPLTPLTRVLQKMTDTRSKSFPVVEGARVVGVIAREDVMRALRAASVDESVAGDLTPPLQ